MKNFFLSIKTFILVALLTTLNMSAQLTGLYTINKNAPASATNFTSFTAFATSINTLGVAGAVSVNVVANTGPYVEQVRFTAISGASSTNSIVINGNGNLITYVSNINSTAWTMNFDGADYFHLLNLNLSGTGTDAYVFLMSSGADFNSCTNCEFFTPPNSSNYDAIPIVISGTNSSLYNISNSANNNTFTSCTARNGYYNVSIVGSGSGSGSTPYGGGNSFINCKFLDSELNCFESTNQSGLVIKGCIFERPNRTNPDFCRAISLEYNTSALIEGNWIRNLFGGATAMPSQGAVGISARNNLDSIAAYRSIVRNNIISDIKTEGQVIGIYFNDENVLCYHNTIALYNVSSASYSSLYGILFYAYNGYPIYIKNNLVYMVLSSMYELYPFFYDGYATYTSSNNLYYADNSAGSGNIAFVDNYNYYNTLASYQANGAEVGSTDLDPNFSSLAGGNYIPTSYNVNNMGTPLPSVPSDYNGTARSASAPDYGAYEFLNIPCAGAPMTSTVFGPTNVICRYDKANLSFGNSNAYGIYTGLNFQWQSSTTSSVGPYTAISGATNIALTTATTTQSMWYNAVITCTNGGGFSTTATALEVQIAGTTTSVVPYYESFEGISGLDKLPNCSWFAPNLGTSARTNMVASANSRIPHTGNRSASFVAGAIDNHYYTEGIYLNAGVTYSASLWYITETNANGNWTDLSIMLGTSQTTTGLVTIASSNGSPVSPAYKSLSNTFSVAASGLYYVSVKASDNGSSVGAPYLTWDDLAIEIPCSLNPNNVSINATPGVKVCQDQTVTLTASGNGSPLWDNGTTLSAITVTPGFSTSYTVTLTNSITGCSTSVSQNIVVNPKPVVSVFAPVTAICKGNSVNINAFGALYYSWSNGSNAPVINVKPTVNTTYTVTGKNQYGCEDIAVQTITVNDLPVVTATANSQICVGEMVTLTASGALSYTWISQNNYVVGSPVVVSPQTSTTYSLTGTDVNGCNGSSSFAVSVAACTGLNEVSRTEGTIRVYPNPNDGAFVIEFNNNDNKRTIEITDVTGRLVSTELASDKKLEVNISNLAAGVYYVKVKSDKASEAIRIIKN